MSEYLQNEMNRNKTFLPVSVIIPHYRENILLDCLNSIFLEEPFPEEVIVVDDASTDGSVARAIFQFPQVRVLRNDTNLGFVLSCNRGLRAAGCRYVVLLNDDTEVEKGWLTALVAFAETHPKVAALQPKILSWQDRRRFDYSGAAGGLIDLFGYPFALGRIFGSTEEDNGQYDKPREIFWASGTAMFLRREVLDTVGYLEETFIAHMEEIDLCWRLHITGFTVWSVPSSIVYHRSGWTLPPSNWLKMYLNHRNSLIMLLKNYSIGSLLLFIPIRIVLDLLSLAVSFVKGEWKRTWAIILAMFWVITHLGRIQKMNSTIQRLRIISDEQLIKRMYRRNIALDYFFGLRSRKEIMRES